MTRKSEKFPYYIGCYKIANVFSIFLSTIVFLQTNINIKKHSVNSFLLHNQENKSIYLNKNKAVSVTNIFCSKCYIVKKIKHLQ